MKKRQRLGLLILNMTILSLVVAGASIYLLYENALQETQRRLAETAKRQARLLAAFTPDDQTPEPTLETLKTVLEAAPEQDGGQLVIVRKEGDRIVFLLNQPDNSTPQPIPWQQANSTLPIRLALEGQSGVQTSVQDHQGKFVIAAYEPVEGTNWGVVAKRDLETFRSPYLEVFGFSMAIAIVLGILGAMIDLQMSRPFLHQLQESEAKNRAIIRKAAEGIITIDDKAVIDTFNGAAEELFGYSAKQVVGKTLDVLFLSFAQGELETALFGTLAPSHEQNGNQDHPDGKTPEKSPDETLEKPLPSPLTTAKRELMGQRQDGTIFPIEMAVSRLREKPPRQYALIVREISDRKAIEDTLKKRNEELELRVEERTTQLMNLNEELLHEISERNNAEESLQDSEKRFRSFFYQSEIGIIQTDSAGQFLKVNPKFSDLVGYSELELQQKTFQDITHPDDLGNAIAQFRQLVNGEIKELSVEQRYLTQDGGELWVSFCGSVVRNAMGEVDYFLGIVEDISDRITTQNALLNSESTLTSFYNSTSLMMGVIELVDNDIRHISDNAVSSEFFRLSAVPLHNQLASEMGVPEDIRRYWTSHCQESLKLGTPVQFEYAYEPEVEDLDTPLRWLSATVSPIPGQDRFSYIVEDITERRQQAEALRRLKEQLEHSTLALDSHQQEMGQLGELSDYLQASLSLEDAYNAIAELVPPLFPDCSGGVFILHEGGSLVEALCTWGDHFNSETIFSPDDSWALRRGRSHWVDDSHPRLFSKHIHRDPLPAETFSIPLIAQGETFGLLYLTAPERGQLMKTKQQFAETVAEQLAVSLHNIRLRLNLKTDRVHDALTGLFNRRYLEEILERELYTAARQNRSVGVLLLDIDYFRNFNHTFSHEAGDVVLKNLGSFLERTLHNTDIAARYGGEELALILPDTTLDEARARAEQLREGVKHLNFEHQNQSLDRITVSVGLATFPDHGMTWEALLKSAEMALSRAKSEGRDCSAQP
ncbi:PAS domain S-box protein [Spirulina sp. CS-785/01]|uniref:PAS domain S-box protein n=1 Tax=Spirulina sp. CS-785/01 TaxID=3021716 RepID=UPI00232EB297|nr:PAS domain S-box protein [Spirulina sp. CS-785/01]MDB9311997.1 PAS domain S-box protein [Spirulina sp. CS-785/01]